MNKSLHILIATGILISLSGCATIFGDKDRQVSVNSKPQGAQVYLNNQYMGITPTTVALNNIWSTNTVQVKMRNYEPVNTNIDSSFQPVGVLNVFFWPGFIVDAISGDMMKIPPQSKNINVTFPYRA